MGKNLENFAFLALAAFAGGILSQSDLGQKIAGKLPF